MRNQYPGPCKDCGGNVPAGEGYFEKQRGGGWAVRHILCTAVKYLEAGSRPQDMSHAQQAALAAVLTKKEIAMLNRR